MLEDALTGPTRCTSTVDARGPGGRIPAVAAHRQPPARYRTVTPRVFVDDVEKAVSFLRTVFDATANIEPGRPTDVQIGDSIVLVGSIVEREAFPALRLRRQRGFDLQTSSGGRSHEP